MSRDPHLSIRYGKLKLSLKKDLEKWLKDGDYKFDDLKDLCHEYIPAGKRNTADSVEKLVDALEKKGALKINEVSMVKVLAEELKLKSLKEKIEQYEWNYILGFSGKASKVAAQTPKKCWGALSGGTKEAVITLKTVLPTVAGAGAVGLAVAASVLAGYNNSPEILQTYFRELLPYAMNLVGLQRGSLYFMLETSSLSSLQQLWTSYKDGSLKTGVKKVIHEIDEVRKLTQGTEIDVTVEIDEDEYREACWVLVLAKSHEFQDVAEKESGKSVQRLPQRRHSLSCKQDLLPPRDNTQFSWQEWRALMEVESKLENEITRRMCVEKQNEELRKEIEVLKVIKDTAEVEREEIMALRMDEEKQNQELRKEIELLKVIKDTKEVERKGIMALRNDVEKQIEELKKEFEVLKGVMDTAKTKIEDIMALRRKNEKLMTELETPKTTEPKTVDKLKKTIEYGEKMLKIAVDQVCYILH